MPEQLKIEAGQTYRAKNPHNVRGFFNDRQVLWMSEVEVQYDGPAVQCGRHYPKVSMKKFLEWAGENVTANLPPGDWQPWAYYVR